MWQENNSDIIIEFNKVDFDYNQPRKWLEGNYVIKTSEFTDGMDFDEYYWLDFCTRYCRERKIDGIQTQYYVGVQRSPNNRSYEYTIIERL